MDAALRSVIERVLEVPELDPDDAALLRALQDGNRSVETVARLQTRLPRGGAFDNPALRAVERAVGWVLTAALAEVIGQADSRDAAILFAEEALQDVEANRPTIPCAPPEGAEPAPVEPAPTERGPAKPEVAEPDLNWEADPAAQPGGRSS